jgi:hypothetical protein
MIRTAICWLALALAASPPPAGAAGPPLLIERLDGPVTAGEIEAFRAHLATVPLPVDNVGKAMVYGTAGSTVEALGVMFEVTGDRAILDRMLAFTDAMLAARNDPQTGRVVWTGQRELGWPNKRPTDAFLGSNWLLLAELRPDLYPILAAAGRAAAATRPDLAARILWAKHQRFTARSPTGASP